MTRVKIGVYNAPKNSGDKNGACARIISSGTKHKREIYKFISDCCTVTSADIAGVLEALTQYIATSLSEGYRVELEGLGYFSPAVSTKKKKKDNGEEVFSASLDGANFRCSPRLKEMIKSDERLKKVKRNNEVATSIEERKNKMLGYLHTSPYINAAHYTVLNNCTSYRANLDIKQFLQDGIIKTEGCRTHKIYMLA